VATGGAVTRWTPADSWTSEEPICRLNATEADSGGSATGDHNPRVAGSSPASGIRESPAQAKQATYDFVAVGENHVVAYGHFRSRGTGSGAEVESPFGQVWTVRHGQAVRMEWYATGEQARKAAGLTG
jgi:hypothetical protein